MAKIAWGATGAKKFETGVDRGVFFPIVPETGAYDDGVAWNGLVSVAEKPSGAEVNKKYADNVVYGVLRSVEEFKASIEAFTYPIEFEKSDGLDTIATGVTIGQQSRLPFGMSYRTLIGNDVEGVDYGYKIHLIYGASVNPSEKNNETINENPEMVTMSWEVETVPVDAGVGFKPTAHLIIDSKLLPAGKLALIEDLIYGTEALPPTLPTPAEIKTLVEAVG